MAKEWDKFVRFMKATFPTKKQLVVRRVPMNVYGMTSLSHDAQRITVSINANDKLATQMETLCHEFGHVMELDAYEEHGKYWGEAYAKAYSAMQKYISGECGERS